MKKCSSCKIEKNLDEFTKNKNLKFGRASQCKSCRKEYYEINKEEIINKQIEYSLINKEKISIRMKEYYIENKDVILEKVKIKSKNYRIINKEKIKEKNRKYYIHNRTKFLFRGSNRRALKLKASPSWLNEEQLDIIKRFYEMAKIMTQISGVVYHVDHVIPLKNKTVCGLHVPWNLQILEASENFSKNNRYDEKDCMFYYEKIEDLDLLKNICEKY